MDTNLLDRASHLLEVMLADREKAFKRGYLQGVLDVERPPPLPFEDCRNRAWKQYQKEMEDDRA